MNLTRLHQYLVFFFLSRIWRVNISRNANFKNVRPMLKHQIHRQFCWQFIYAWIRALLSSTYKYLKCYTWSVIQAIVWIYPNSFAYDNLEGLIIWRKQVKCWCVCLCGPFMFQKSMSMYICHKCSSAFFYGDNTWFKINRKHWLWFHVNNIEDINIADRRKNRNTNIY